MTKIYFVRHCEAMGNVMHIFQGVSDFDISETGAKQLEFLKKKFDNIKLDKIYSSPLIRAYKTALAVKGDKEIDVIKHDGLIEINGGIIEGKPTKESFNNHPDLADAWVNSPQDFYPQDGEHMRDAYNRIYKTILELVNENRDKTIACASHGGVTRCLICNLIYGDINQLKDTPWADNTAVALISVDDDNNMKLEFYNDTTHLPSEYLPETSRLNNYKR